jgi:hypothetical protein
MSSLSKLVACRVLVILLAMTLGVFGVRTLQAKGKGCQTGCRVQSCETNCPAVDKHAQHEAEEAREREEKAAEHARHEAEEECARQQKAYEHAQHEAEEARERAEAKQPACNMCAPKCEPVCAPRCEPVCAPKCEPKEISAVIVVKPAPQPTPEPFPQGLPKTASPTSLLGLVGVLSLTGVGLRFHR